MRAILITILAVCITCQLNLNNQPVASINAFSFYTPVANVYGKSTLWQYSLTTYYDT